MFGCAQFDRQAGIFRVSRLKVQWGLRYTQPSGSAIQLIIQQDIFCMLTSPPLLHTRSGLHREVQTQPMSALIDQDLLFPAEERSRAIARQLYGGVKNLPIVSPHGHTDPRW